MQSCPGLKSVLHITAAFVFLVFLPSTYCQAEDRQAADGQDIIVLAPDGTADLKGIKPIMELTGRQIQSLAAGTTNDLTGALMPLLQARTGSRHAPPLLLLNGRRQALQEIGEIPTEAVRGVQVFAPPAAASLGHDAQRIVINYITAPKFAKDTLSTSLNYNTAFQSSLHKTEYRRFRMMRDQRTSLNVEGAYSLLPGRSRTPQFGVADLNPSIARFAASLQHARVLPAVGSLQFSAAFNLDRDSRKIPPVGDNGSAATERSLLRFTRVEVGLNSHARDWEILSSLTWDWRVSALSRTGAKRQQLAIHYLEGRVEASGPLFPLGLTEATGIASLNFNALSSIGGFGPARRSIAASQFGGRMGIRLPLMPTGGNGPSELDVSGGIIANRFNGETPNTGWYLATAWSPRRSLRFDIAAENNPILDDMTNAVTTDTTHSSVPYYDYRTGQSVQVEMIGGGADRPPVGRNRYLRVSGSWSDIASLPLSFSVYWATQSSTPTLLSLANSNPITQILAPERFIRDESGRLVLVDARSLLVGARRRSELTLSLGTFFTQANGSNDFEARSPLSVNAALSVTQSLRDCVSLPQRPPVCGIDAAIALDGVAAARREFRFDASLSTAIAGGSIGLSYRNGAKASSGRPNEDFSRPALGLLSLNLYHHLGRPPTVNEVDRRLRLRLTVDNVRVAPRPDDTPLFAFPRTYLLSLEKAI